MSIHLWVFLAFFFPALVGTLTPLVLSRTPGFQLVLFFLVILLVRSVIYFLLSLWCAGEVDGDIRPMLYLKPKTVSERLSVPCVSKNCHVQYPHHYLHFPVTVQVSPQGPSRSSPVQASIPIRSSISPPSIRVPSKNSYLGVCICVKGNLKGVLMSRLIKLLHISKMTPSFSNSLFKLLGAEYHRSPSSTTDGTLMSFFSAPRMLFQPSENKS